MATFTQSRNGSTLITIKLEGTSPAATYPTYINKGGVWDHSLEKPPQYLENIVLDLNPVKGTTGISASRVTMLK